MGYYSLTAGTAVTNKRCQLVPGGQQVCSNKRFSSFPLYMKIWNDTMAVTANLNRKDSVLKKLEFSE